MQVRPRGPAKSDTVRYWTVAAAVKLETWRDKLSETAQELLPFYSSQGLIAGATSNERTHCTDRSACQPLASLFRPGHSAKDRGSRDVIVTAIGLSSPKRPPDRQRDPDKSREARRQQVSKSAKPAQLPSQHQRNPLRPIAQTRSSRNPISRSVQASLFRSQSELVAMEGSREIFIKPAAHLLSQLARLGDRETSGGCVKSSRTGIWALFPCQARFPETIVS